MQLSISNGETESALFVVDFCRYNSSNVLVPAEYLLFPDQFLFGLCALSPTAPFNPFRVGMSSCLGLGVLFWLPRVSGVALRNASEAQASYSPPTAEAWGHPGFWTPTHSQVEAIFSWSESVQACAPEKYHWKMYLDYMDEIIMRDINKHNAPDVCLFTWL